MRRLSTVSCTLAILGALLGASAQGGSLQLDESSVGTNGLPSQTVDPTAPLVSGAARGGCSSGPTCVTPVRLASPSAERTEPLHFTFAATAGGVRESDDPSWIFRETILYDLEGTPIDATASGSGLPNGAAGNPLESDLASGAVIDNHAIDFRGARLLN